MDAISLAIVVTVLSLGSILVYLFKSDFEGRQKKNAQSFSGSKKNVNTAAFHHQKQPTSSSKQQVPLEVSKQSSSINKQQSQSTSKQAVNTNTNNNSKYRGKDSDNVAPTIAKQVAPLVIADSLEPSQDELDSSILLGVFNPTNSKPANKIGGKKSEQVALHSSSQVLESKKASRRKQEDQKESSQLNLPITSEQLVGLIDTSSLSKDEIELAVETLLNKLDSGESNWKQPKSDPIGRLKARLRDNETALSTEIANHENTRARLGQVKEENTHLIGQLEQVRSDLFKQQILQKQLKDENTQLASKLEQARCDLSKQQLIQNQLKEENAQAIGQLDQARCDSSDHQQILQKQIQEVEHDKAQLQAMLLERHLNEASMKRTLIEMEHELKELQSKLSANSASNDERMNIAGQREQKLMSEMRELREGLSALFPDIKLNSARNGADGGDWIHQYLGAVEHLAKTVDDVNNNDVLESPSKMTVDKSTSTLHTKKPSSRVSSPVSNGRSSKAGSYYDNDGKKEMENKLLELSDYINKLEEEMAKTKQENLTQSIKLNQQQQQPQSESSHEQLIKELKMQKSKLEAQVKIGLDSLKMEQERTRNLEEELSKFSMANQQQVTS